MAAKNVYSVGQVNNYIKHMFDEDYLLRSILVRGEVSNCKYHSSGHIYFTLKDASGTLSCVMFASRVRGGLSFRMKEGDQVVVQGAVSAYPKGGSYQLYAERIIQDGVGLLNERFELLKKKLEEMGMFDEAYKQPIPKYIRRLGVVTAPTGAAVQDIINIATRRNPYVEIVLYPALVQGEGAAQSVANGIRALDTLGDRDPSKKIDVIICGRGGGSLEDLWAFNEEAVAQAIFDCQTPIISAVGHETDTTIADYVADLRAPTPSAGAELAVYDLRSYLNEVSRYQERLTQSMLHSLTLYRGQVLAFQKALVHLSPASKVREQRMQIVGLEEKLQAAMQGRIDLWRRRVDVSDRMQNRMERKLMDRQHQMQMLTAKLDQLSPLKRLSGSYGFVTDDAEHSVKNAADLIPGDTIHVRMKDGKITASVEAVETL